VHPGAAADAGQRRPARGDAGGGGGGRHRLAAVRAARLGFGDLRAGAALVPLALSGGETCRRGWGSIAIRPGQAATEIGRRQRPLLPIWSALMRYRKRLGALLALSDLLALGTAALTGAQVQPINPDGKPKGFERGWETGYAVWHAPGKGWRL